MEIESRTIEYRVGDELFEGLLAFDAEVESARPGIVIAHTIRGRTEFEEGKASQLAEAGYAACAIDVYGKDRIGSKLEACRDLMDALKADRAELQRRILAALEALRAQPEVDASMVAAIGFCFGGMTVLDLARSGEDLAGVVSFHGLFEPPDNVAQSPIRCKVLVLHGWDDPLATPDQALALAGELTALGADWQIHGYGNVRHAFTNPAADASTGVTVYNAAADRRSWASMHSFLSELFGS